MKRQSTITNFFGKRVKESVSKTDSVDQDPSNQSDNTNKNEKPNFPSPSSLGTNSSPKVLDIGDYVGKVLSTEEKLTVLEKCWTPDPNYNFPLVQHGNQKRKFQFSWLQKHTWLTYSELQKGGFCKFCVVFAQRSCQIGNQDVHTFVVSPYQKFRKPQLLIAHSLNKYHQTSMEKAGNLLKIVTMKDQSVASKVNDRIAKIIAENRRRLTPIIKTILFCAQNNLSLRGHRDDGQIVYSDNSIACTDNEGMFRALLNFRIDSGDQDLKTHFENMQGNATMISKTIQNELIECIGDVILNNIVSRVNKSKFYTILLDETTDISKKEQLSVSVRYFDVETCEVREDFIDFFVINDTTGNGIRNKLKEILKKVGLNVENLRGQGYDGGSNMAGKFNGVQALMLEEFPLALYCHCFNHSLNLAISSACKITEFACMFDTLSACCNFFSSAKRNDLLQQKIENSEITTTKKKRLKAVCATRWVERHESVLTFKELYPAIVEALEAISDWEDREVAGKAAIRLKSIKDGRFLIALGIAVECLSVTLPISKSLQDPCIDLNSAMDTIDSVKSVFLSMRKNSERDFKKIFVSCKTLAESVNSIITMPRTTSTQKHRSNAKAGLPEAYFRINMYIPFLDSIAQELNTRFNERFKNIIPLQSLIPAHIERHSIEQILEAATFYQGDIPCSLDELKGQLILWREQWAGAGASNAPRTAVEALKTITIELNGVRTLLQLFATLPVSTATSERSFSRLKLIKTYLRSTVSQDRLSGLAIASIHRNIIVNIKEVIELFALRKPRRMKLTNWAADKLDPSD